MRKAGTTALGHRGSFAFPVLLVICILSATLLSEELASEVKCGLRLAVGAIVPSLFPFMIFADLITSSSGEGAGAFLKPIERLFGISSASARAFLIGNIAGAPVSATMLSSTLEERGISRSEAERTLAISSSPSLAFAVSGVGAAMWGDTAVGLALYLSVILASVIYGALTKVRPPAAAEQAPAVCRSFDLMASIERATFASLRVIGTVTAFSVASGLITYFSATAHFAPFVIPLLELGNAASYLSECELPREMALGLTAFSLGFSGLSIHLQVKGALSKSELDYSRFFRAKLIIGILSAAIFIAVYSVALK